MAGKGKTVGKIRAAQIVGANDHLLDEAVAHINRLYVAKGLETARDIGAYVLTAFFDGDSAAYQKRGNGHETFRKLAEHPGLQVSYSFIYNAVAVCEQLSTLPADLASALPLSHHKILLPVKDAGQKIELARLAVEGEFAKSEVRRDRWQTAQSGDRWCSARASGAARIREGVGAVETAL